MSLYMSLYNLVTDNFKEYDFDTEYCLNIYISRLYCAYRQGPQCTALTGAYIADKTALTVRHSSFTLHEHVSAVHSMAQANIAYVSVCCIT